MLSSSRSTRYPAFSYKPNDFFLTDDVDTVSRLGPDQVRLWSYQEPALVAGSYAIKTNQTLQVEGSGNLHSLDLPDKSIEVPGPKLKLLDPKDIHTVYPASGHSDYSETLAHVVFRHPTSPWERRMDPEKIGFNRMPWLAVLSFTEDELALDVKSYMDAGFGKRQPSRYGTIATTPKDVVQLSSIACPLDKAEIGLEYEADDSFQLLLLKPDLFQTLFSNSEAKWTGSADLSRYAMMAHVREIHGGFMATTDANDPQPQHSVVVSPRSGPPGLVQPTRIISHLISLEGIEKMDLAKDGISFASLISLHSWDWMCVPHEDVDFADVMRGLGKSVQPLRVPDEYIDSLKNEEPLEANTWLANTLRSGYALKTHTLKTGKETKALFRGPLIPILSISDAITPVPIELEVIDKETGLVDVSYSAAWNLARATAMADKSFTTSLLRLRGTVHAEAVKKAKQNALGVNGMDVAAFLQQLEASVDEVVRAQDVSGLANRGAEVRWLRKESDRNMLPAVRLTADTQYTYGEYSKEIADITAIIFGFPGKDGKPAKPIDPDAMVIRAWILDRFYLAGVPLHYLITDPDMVPRETIRTFTIDPAWVGAFIDGALSLANHFAEDDDALRMEIKNCINRYLREPQQDGPCKGTTLQIPKWGFLIRSVAVTTFPDMKIEVRLSEKPRREISEVLYMQVLADDILIVLIDRIPGQDNFDKIIISQPHHQQTFAVGDKLLETKLHTVIRPIPLDPKLKLVTSKLKALSWNKKRDPKPPVFDFDTRMLRPKALTLRYFTEIERYNSGSRMGGKVFMWKRSEGLPSSILAAQLGKPVLQLKLNVEAPEMKNGSSGDDKNNRHLQPAAQLYIRPREFVQKRTATKRDAGNRPDPGFAKLPTGSCLTILAPVHGNSSKMRVPNIPNNKILQHTIWKEEIIHTTPREVSCHPIYDPASKSGSLYAVDEPIDLIFGLKDHLRDGDPHTAFPQRIKVRIPVIFSSNDSPSVSRSGIMPMLVIPGSALAPILPEIESLDRGSRWLYTTKLVTGTICLERDTPEQPPAIVFVVTLTSRLKDSKLQGKGRQFDGSFILRNVSLVKPNKGSELESYQTSFDVAWFAPPHQTVRSKKMTIRRATTLKILEPTYYEPDLQHFHVSLASSDPISDSQRLCLISRYKSSDNLESTFIELGSLRTSTFEELKITIDKHAVPKWVKFVVRSESGEHENMGPMTELWIFPNVPLTNIIPRLRWTDDLQIYWDVPPAHEPLVNITFTLKHNETELVKETVSTSGEVKISKDAISPFVVDGCIIRMKLHTWVTIPKIRGGETYKDIVLERQKRGEPLEVPAVFDSARVAQCSGLVGVEEAPGQFGYWYTTADSLVLKHLNVTTLGERSFHDYQISFASYDAVLFPGSTLACCYNTSTKVEIVFWIGQDGCIRASGRVLKEHQNGADQWISVSYFKDDPGSVCPTGGGSMELKVVYITGFVSGTMHILWWVGGNGQIFMACYQGIKVSGPIEIVPQAVATGGRRLSEIRTYVEYDEPKTMCWIDQNGDLAYLHIAWMPAGHLNPIHYIVPSADASPEGGLEIFKIINYGTLDVRNDKKDADVIFVFWITRKGSVYGAYGHHYGRADRAWTRFEIAPPGSAHISTRVRAVAGEREKHGFYVLWFNPEGRLQVAIPRWEGGEHGESLIWSCAEFQPTVDTPTDGMMNILVVPSSIPNQRQLLWVKAGDGCLGNLIFYVLSSYVHPPILPK